MLGFHHLLLGLLYYDWLADLMGPVSACILSLKLQYFTSSFWEIGPCYAYAFIFVNKHVLLLPLNIYKIGRRDWTDLIMIILAPVSPGSAVSQPGPGPGPHVPASPAPGLCSLPCALGSHRTTTGLPSPPQQSCSYGPFSQESQLSHPALCVHPFSFKRPVSIRPLIKTSVDL